MCQGSVIGETASRRVLPAGQNGGPSMQNDSIIQIMDRTDCSLVRGVKEFAVVKRSVVVGGHKTSVSLEDAFWTSLKDIATRRGLPLSTQIDAIDRTRKTANLSSAIRLFVLDHFRTRAVTSVFIGERQPSPSIVPG
jgi:predicted DNA-binding ribbon-helix-helix protein